MRTYSRNASLSWFSPDNFARSFASALVVSTERGWRAMNGRPISGKLLKVGNHRFEQFIQQAVKGLRCFLFSQEMLDVFEVTLEIGGEFDDRFFRHKQTLP